MHWHSTSPRVPRKSDREESTDWPKRSLHSPGSHVGARMRGFERKLALDRPVLRVHDQSASAPLHDQGFASAPTRFQCPALRREAAKHLSVGVELPVRLRSVVDDAQGGLWHCISLALRPRSPTNETCFRLHCPPAACRG